MISDFAPDEILLDLTKKQIKVKKKEEEFASILHVIRRVFQMILFQLWWKRREKRTTR